jgi:glucosamine kinase
MILIADSGTSKTEWCIITDEGTTQTLFTPGINPFYQDSENISIILQKEFTGDRKFDSIYFYGAGCINKEKQDNVRKSLTEVFEVAHILIGSDLLAAVHSMCQDQSGIVCILGTGSNSCLYNGSEIVANVSPLGFILGDEGSGAVLGKKLIGDILKKQLPQGLINIFFDTYHTTSAEILENVYKKPFPSRYLASFAKFLSENIAHPEIENIVVTSFAEFVTRNLIQYPGIESIPIHFTGSIAFHFEAQLSKVIQQQHLILGNIEQAPMKGLVRYHSPKVSL